MYVLGLAICVAPLGLQQTAEHSFCSISSGREVSSVELYGRAKMATSLVASGWGQSGGQVRTAGDGRPDPPARVATLHRVSPVQFGSPIYHASVHPHIGRRGHRDLAVRSGMEEESPGKTLRPRLSQARRMGTYSQTRARVANILPSFCTKHTVFSRPDPASLNGKSD